MSVNLLQNTGPEHITKLTVTGYFAPDLTEEGVYSVSSDSQLDLVNILLEQGDRMKSQK